jgi:hypothetical protein
MEEPKCKIDGTPMKPGIALQMTPVYVEEWYGTVSYPEGFPRLVNVHKCPTCGRSIKKGVAND